MKAWPKCFFWACCFGCLYLRPDARTEDNHRTTSPQNRTMVNALASSSVPVHHLLCWLSLCMYK